jgi:uncharacterized SAM-binding protein YcdF (DUF218 family)
VLDRRSYLAAGRLLFLLVTGTGALWGATLLLVLLAGARPVLRPADAILVLGAAQYNGRPSPVFRARLEYALELYRDGYADRLIFTGGVGARDTLAEADVARRWALARDVPPEAILVERQGVTSAQSVMAAGDLMRAHGLQSALIVSDPFHMLRLELLARRAGIHPLRAPTPISPFARVRGPRWRFVLRESVLFPVTALLGAR